MQAHAEFVFGCIRIRLKLYSAHPYYLSTRAIAQFAIIWLVIEIGHWRTIV
jgi:hypothetical protein